MKYEFVTAMMKGKTDGFAISGGDAQSGLLNMQYDGPRPVRPPPAKGTARQPYDLWLMMLCDDRSVFLRWISQHVSLTRYQPMQKQGSIILGIGGDNSAHAGGTWYEGCLTAGVSSAATDAKVQANIVAAGYGK